MRTFDTFSQPLAELIEARIWAGLHYRSADVAGQALGRNVANYGAANYFAAGGSLTFRTATGQDEKARASGPSLFRVWISTK